MWAPWKFNNKVGVDGGVWGGGSMETWGGLHNTKAGGCGFMDIRGRGWVRGRAKTRGLAVCVQNPCRACAGNRLLATSTSFRLCISLGLTHVHHRTAEPSFDTCIAWVKS